MALRLTWNAFIAGNADLSLCVFNYRPPSHARAGIARQAHRTHPVLLRFEAFLQTVEQSAVDRVSMVT